MKFEQVASRFSLKSRVAIMSAALVAMVLVFAGFIVLEYHQMAAGGAEIARRSHDEMTRGMEMQDSLSQIARLASLGEVNESEIAHFRRLVSQVRSHAENSEVTHEVGEIEEKFNQFVTAIQSTKLGSGWGQVKRVYYDDVAAAVAALTERNQSSIYALADSLKQKQTRALQVVLISVLIFVFMLGFTGYWFIAYLTNPLMTMAKFIDGIDVETMAPLSVPVFGSSPEVALVSRAFDRLLERLRGYRALNLRRLLSEKRRADIIAASISDGIILLKGQEVLYANPVAELILRFGEDRGMKAMLSAVSQTMPVEFSMETDDGRHHFLIQAFPISHELVDQIGDQQTIDVAGEFQATTIVVAQDVTLVKESQDAKGHFLATLSHEVKTPVTSLTLATRMLLRSVDELSNPIQRNLVRTCTEDVDRLRGLLDDLLTVSRFDSLTQKIEFQHTDFTKLLKHAVQSFSVQAKEKDIQLTTEMVNPERRPLTIPMDPTKITWAVSNLLTNALRHSPRHSEVQVRLEVKPEWIEVRVRDSGPGIDKRRLERIFDKFSSFYDIRVARSGSVGLGLSIAREIIQAHGGRIWATSEMGDGAEFGFVLPMKQSFSAQSGQNNVLISKGVNSGTSSRSG